MPTSRSAGQSRWKPPPWRVDSLTHVTPSQRHSLRCKTEEQKCPTLSDQDNFLKLFHSCHHIFCVSQVPTTGI